MIGDMYGDFSRLTFAPEKHFSAVLLQQGRVMVDADANEQAAIFLHNLRRLIVDVVGPYGAPAGDDANFAITLDTSAPGRPLLGIAAGHYYAGGLLCQADAATGYYEQPDAFLDPELDSDRLPDPPYVVYLRAWERHISALVDPSIREQALGDNGPDTAGRTKVVWQVVVTDEFPPGSGDKVADWAAVDADSARQLWADWEEDRAFADRPQLRARARAESEGVLEPCLASPSARYRGLENQLYRVEIHDGGEADGEATFKWSRENGAVVFPIEELAGTGATVATLGRDPGLGLAAGDWVEVVDDRSALRGDRQPLVRVTRVDPLERLVELEHAPSGATGQNAALHPFLRRWDQQEAPVENGFPKLDPATGLLEVVEGSGDGGWLKIEDGVEIQFAEGGEYSPGDYWLIPARTAIEDVEWPQDAMGPAPRPPLGVEYAYAPLALVDGASDVIDLRSVFGPLAQPVP